MTLISHPLPDVHILEKCVSWSGSYLGFYGNHYHEGRLCYVVGVSDKRDGEILMRHYNEKSGCVNQEAAKFASRTYWEQFRLGLERAPTAEESSETSAALEQWFDKFDRSGVKPGTA